MSFLVSPTLNLRIAAVCALLFSYAWACFTPFAWQAPLIHWSSGVERTATGGFDFSAPGFVVLKNDLLAYEDFEQLTVSFAVRSSTCDQQGPARIISWSASIVARNFTIGQQGCDLQVRVLRDGSDENGTPAFTVADLFARSYTGEPDVVESNTGKPDTGLTPIDRVQVTLGVSGIQISVNGEQRLSQPLVLSNWNAGFPLLLGNEVGRERPWLGQLEDLAVSIDGVIVADADSDWEILATGWMVADHLGRHYSLIPFANLRDPPSYASAEAVRSQRLDIPLNVIGFLPFGALLAWLSVGVGRAVLWSLLFSLCIELVQLGIVGRYSSITDVMLNGLGGGLGALLGRRWLGWLASKA